MSVIFNQLILVILVNKLILLNLGILVFLVIFWNLLILVIFTEYSGESGVISIQKFWNVQSKAQLRYRLSGL